MFCYFRISIAGSPPKTVVFKLSPDKCPNTCDNFLALCQSPFTAKRPNPQTNVPSNNQPTYRGTEFHRILPKFMIQGGDFTHFNGTGGYAAYVADSKTNKNNNKQLTFDDENFDISHSQEGVLSMANKGPNTNGSQFFITLGKALHLDGKHVAFGKVVRGMEIIREASLVETEGNENGGGRPVRLQRVVIVDCGVGTGEKDSSDDSSSSSFISSSSESSLSERRKRSKSGKKKRKRKDEDSKKKKRRRSSEGHGKGGKYDRYRGRNSVDSDRRKRKKKEGSSHRHKQRRRYSSDSSISGHSEEERRKHSRKKRHGRESSSK